MKTKDSTEMTPDGLFVPTYKRGGAPIVRGAGMYLYDSDGKEFLDFGAGIAVNALGYGHPALLEAMKDQAWQLIHASNLYHSQPQIDFAARLVKHSFASKVFLCNSGTEANEAAIKFARKRAAKISSQRYHVLSFSESFHGRTYGSLSATAQPKFHIGFGPLPAGFHYSQFNDIQSAKAKLDEHDFAAIIVEPLQAEGGVNTADADFLQFLREYATAHSIALIFDEIQCGTGRTGSLWYYEQTGVVPDIMTLAKPIGGGMPLGAVLCTEETAACVSPGDHGTTFGGNPVACAMGSCVIDTVSDPAFLKKVRDNGEYLKNKLEELRPKFPSIRSVRGHGLLLGVRFKEDPGQVIEACKNNGLLLIRANLNTIRFLPPLIVETEHIDKAINIFEGVLKSLM
ncbi:MAG: aspartate aminotransferase family protein [Chitinispirillales bacterium]|jgi:predicted acetylornithine/succinylornithine family transaminase|nr:aspartate aminotransferase family protein [Chitinispirillales bacterium]